MQAFTLPRPLKQLFTLLPQYPHSVALAHALNLTLGNTLRSRELRDLHGKLLCLRILDAGIVLHFTLGQHGISARPAGGAPALSISAKAHDFLQLALREEDPDTLFFSRRLLMEGDTELGLLLKNTLDALELPSPAWRTLMPAGLKASLKQGIYRK